MERIRILKLSSGFIRRILTRAAIWAETNIVWRDGDQIGKEYGYAANAAAWNRRAAEITEARRQVQIVLSHGSMGPTGQFMVLAALTQADVYDAFRVQAVALEQGGADVVVP